MSERQQTGLIGAEELLADQAKAIETFLGREVLPQPPARLLEFVERTSEQGFTFEPYLEPSIVFTQDSEFPGWKVKPEAWFWEQIRKGNISPDAARLNLIWAAMEGIQKPNYEDGKQLYENDPLAPILEKLRKAGKITVPDWCSNVPAVSRYGVSSDEIEQYVVPNFAELTRTEADDIEKGTPPYIAWNFRGNLAHPEWGKTNTSEWFSTRFGDDRRLFGGHSGLGGFAYVYCNWLDSHFGYVGFRLRVAFPSQS